MMTDEKKSAALVLGAVAIAAGLVTTTFLLSRRRAMVKSIEPAINISDMLGDCRNRIDEIEAQLARSSGIAASA